MKICLYQKLAIGALVSVLALMFIGAIVRVTGAGMGCPDWPTCWGLLIPPTHVEQVDFAKLPIEKFKAKAERMGRDPDTITADSLRSEFNPRHVWTEFFNRLSSLPVMFFSLATMVASFWQKKIRPHVFWLSFTAVLLVLANALMGARVVYSGLAPGILSAHLALAMMLICVLVYCAWAGSDRPWRITMDASPRMAHRLVGILLFTVVAEGIMGSQIREMTDELAKANIDSPRSTWIAELEHSWIYLIHRSFSWVILIVTCIAFWRARKQQPSGSTYAQKGVLGIVLTQMFLGLIMAQIHIYSWVQVLHVGLAAILLVLVFRWFLTIPRNANGRVHPHTAVT